LFNQDGECHKRNYQVTFIEHFDYYLKRMKKIKLFFIGKTIINSLKLKLITELKNLKKSLLKGFDKPLIC
jgi:hypothetical protein